MKKIFLSCILIFMFSMSCANAVIIKDSEKYISIDEAEKLWNIEIDLKERSKVIEVKTEEETVLLQIGSNVVAKNSIYNPLFIDIDMFKLKGTERIDAAPFVMDEEVYIPIEVFYDLLYEEN